jgi:hypothetical protein
MGVWTSSVASSGCACPESPGRTLGGLRPTLRSPDSGSSSCKCREKWLDSRRIGSGRDQATSHEFGAASLVKCN